MTRALITGVIGQDGSYLSELLVAKGYEVFGMVRSLADPRIDALQRSSPEVRPVAGDLVDRASLARALDAAAPDEVYNLAAMSSARRSLEDPVSAAEVNGVGPLRLLEALRAAAATRTRLFQASSSEVFGAPRESPQSERTQLRPRGPYGAAKAFAQQMVANYREDHGLFAVSGILFNHESPRRGLEFVTRKISYHAAAIKLGKLARLELGNLDAERDWGFAGDVVRAMHLMLRRPIPDDLVIGTGETHTVREFAATAFAHVGLDWRDHVVTSAAHDRPAETLPLRADTTRARTELGWSPSVTFTELVVLMVESDLRLLAAGAPTR